MFSTVLVILAVTMLYWFPARRWFALWGTTEEERARVMAGDPVASRITSQLSRSRPSLSFRLDGSDQPLTILTK